MQTNIFHSFEPRKTTLVSAHDPDNLTLTLQFRITSVFQRRVLQFRLLLSFFVFFFPTFAQIRR